MTEPSTSAVDLAVAARIAAVKIRVAAARERRDDLAAARRRGLARRHVQKLNNLAAAEQRAQQQTLDEQHDDDGCLHVHGFAGSSPKPGGLDDEDDQERDDKRYGYA